MNYLDKVDTKILDYFKVLEPNFPTWLYEYINTKEMLHQQYISITCGTIYSNLYESEFFYSNLDHSIGVSLIIWHFTHNKKQTLSGLFHDIATPAFKHCIDFLNGDYIKQESTEDLTRETILNSKEIMTLLKRDNIKVDEVCDYHIYPIADNDTSKLSSDRLEYSLANALFTYNLSSLKVIEEIYNDISIQTNEEGINELGFNTEKFATKFVKITSTLSIIYREDRTRYSMQLIADIIKKLCEDKILTKDDLYKLKESEVIEIIENSVYKNIYNKWKNASKIKTSEKIPEEIYFVHQKSKVRYIDPLFKGSRISKISSAAKKLIEDNLNYDMTKYVYLENIDFNNL